MPQTIYRVLLLSFLLFAFFFALNPSFDLKITHLFYTNGFAWSLSPFAQFMRKVGMYLPITVALIAFFNLFTKRFDVRISYFLLTSGFLAPVLIVNMLLKDFWHRARPVQVLEFGGKFDFTPWYEIGKQCAKNCSFVSGEASGAFWLLGLVFVVPRPIKRLAFLVIFAFATYISLLRLAFGGHFFSDIVFAAIITYMVLQLTHTFFFETSNETKN
jgi:lipid A 4'-phosphatase